MSDTFTGNLKIRKPSTGAYNNTWGAVVNSDAFELFDTAIAGETTVSIGSSVAYSMPAMSQGMDSATRYFCVRFSGTPTAAVVITLPGSVTSKFYLIDNFNTAQQLTFTYGVGSTHTVAVAAGEKRLIWCDGTNCWDVNTASAITLGGLAAANFARVARSAAEVTASTIVQNVFSDVNQVHPFHTLALPGGSTITLDPTNGDVQQITLTANYTIGVPVNGQDGSQIELMVIQDGTGGRSLAWNSIFLFQGAAVPTLSSVAGGIDKFILKYNAGLNKWLVSVFGNITSPSGASYPLTIAANVTDWKLAPLLGSMGGPITVTITVNQGVQVVASSPLTPAMDLSGLPSGSTVNLINNGLIAGAGGRGGNGAGCSSGGGGSYQTVLYASAGLNGGNAILGPGLSRTFNVTNGAGKIWGGGGGGGGGSASIVTSASDNANGGGGGAGAGGAYGGLGGNAANLTYLTSGFGLAGGNSAAGLGGVAGAGGVAGTNGGGATAGGVGGGYGAAGTAGANSSFNPSFVLPGGAAGTAGKAIELQGAPPPTVGGSVLGLVS
jgi:hypothetical protein